MISDQLYFFETDNKNSYVYDNNTSYIVPFSKIDRMVLEYYNEDFRQIQSMIDADTLEKAKRSYEYISNLIKCGMFKKHPNINYEDNYDNIIRYPSSRLILIVTESCNMKCTHCVFSDHYPGIKSFSEKTMDYSTACKAVDYFMKLHEEKVKHGLRHNPTITFYGGEPLLNFTLIKDVMDYCKNYKHDTQFLITTNGLLLNNNYIVETLVKNNVHLTISLDGDKDETNRRRILTNGNGSYDLILSGIQNYRQILSKEHKKTPLLFSACYDTKTSVRKSIDFFESKKELFGDYYVLFSQVNPNNTTYYDQFSDDDYVKFDLEAEKIKFEFFESQKAGQHGKFNKYSIFTKYGIFKLRTGGPSPVIQKTCVIGSRMAVDPKGDFFICERVNQQLPIGNIENGINYNQIRNISLKFNMLREKYCNSCNISKLCDICYAYLINQNEMNFNNEFCKSKKESIYQMIKLSYSTLEINPYAFDDLYDTKDINNIIE